ncbi:MAG: hypothetical protein P4L46_19845 [Fimbriimonas sp.]|nr:hypothetical protein [Fimbriimonas sp.]
MGEELPYSVTADEPTGADKAKPTLERTIAFASLLVAVFLAILLAARECLAHTTNATFATLIAGATLVVLVATAIARPHQDEHFAPKWGLITYPIILGAAAFVFISASWTSQESLELSPALLPGLGLFVSLVAPFVVPNQMAFGLGGIAPKCFLMSAAMHYTANTDWGIFASNNLISPQTAICSMVLFTALTSTIFMAFKLKLPSWIMILIAAVITFPCIHKIEAPLVVFHIL